MKDTASYCDKTIAQTKQNIRQTETNLKNVTAKEEYRLKNPSRHMKQKQNAFYINISSKNLTVNQINKRGNTATN